MKTKMKPLLLPKVLKVEGSNCSNYINSHHLQFQFNMYELVKAVDKQKLHLTDELLKIWADCLEMETELNKQATATVQTEQMKALDQQRDDLLTNLFGVVRAQLKSPVTAGGVDNYATVIVQSKNPHFDQIIQDFNQFVGFFQNKPE